jgi:2-iminobutanoate/2-iminopropanoate deaminase
MDQSVLFSSAPEFLLPNRWAASILRHFATIHRHYPAAAGRIIVAAQEKHMNRPIIPAGIRAPFSRYSHGMEIPPGSRLVFCSGQLGIAPDDTIPPDTAGQARLCFANIEAVLREAGMGLADIVRINAYVTAREHLQPYMEVRNALFTEALPASTLMIVSGFARPEFTVEIEAVAAAI